MGKGIWIRVASVLGGALLASSAWGQVPSSVDPGRIDQRPQVSPVTVMPKASLPVLHVPPGVAAPAGSNQISFVLHSVHFEGMEAFSEAQVQALYAPYLGKKITLDMVWLMAGQLAERYQREGYFLSRVYVPAQEIAGGDITLRVVEGYISDIRFDDALNAEPVVQAMFATLQNQHPVKALQLESMLLRLNDLPGVSVRAVLALPKEKNAPEGATALDLVRVARSDSGRVSVDNNGSRYLGPYEPSAQYQAALLPLQRTSVSGLGSLPFDELRYGSIRHEIPVAPGVTVEGHASYTEAYPGHTLKLQEIESASLSSGLSVAYQWIRQRDENLSLKLAFDTRDTRSTILGTPLTQDAIRALRTSATYDIIDRWQGYNQGSVTLSQGIAGLGASRAGDAYLSRGEAKPDFTKAELTLTRLQALGQNFNAFTALSGQVARGPLYSSEEFGYGGQAFGRAYDASEITGDHGLSAAMELRYTGLGSVSTGMFDDFGNWLGLGVSAAPSPSGTVVERSSGSFALAPMPYVFYDAGTVWNDDTSQPARTSGSSAGLGLRTSTDSGLSTNLGLAFPLTKSIDTPLRGNGKNPRIMLEVNYAF